MSKEGYTKLTVQDEVFARRESEVRSYGRQWPTVFVQAKGAELVDVDGKKYIDFFAGAGALNYGHNDPDMIKSIQEYLGENGIIHGLDMYTDAKAKFLKAFEKYILEPSALNYKIQFTGPTGTNAVEAALKLSRKVTGRSNVISFTNAFHGVSLAALSLTGNSGKRKAAGVNLNNVTHIPFDNYSDGIDGLTWLETALADNSSGIDLPAAVFIETVQGEGGINVASADWLRRLAAICRKFDILLVVDDVQMGCGRTGEFFSFEDSGITPDIVVLSKSIGGVGLPMAILLIRPDLDIWKPAEHNGTFRGNNLAFVGGTVALEKFWMDKEFTKEIKAKGEMIEQSFQNLINKFPQLEQRGRGMARGLVLKNEEMGDNVIEACFRRGLLVETSGPDAEVLKLLPPLTITKEQLKEGLDIIDSAVTEVITGSKISV